VAAVEHVGDVLDLPGPHRGVAADGPQVGVPEAFGDVVDRDAVIEQGGRPVGAQRVRMAEPLGDPGRQAVAADELVHRLRGERLGRLCAGVAAESHEQGLLVAQPAAAGEPVRREPRLERGERLLGDRDLAFGAALAADVEAAVAGVRSRGAQVARLELAQLRRAEAAVAQDAQQRIVAPAGRGPAIGDAQQVVVLEVGVSGGPARWRGTFTPAATLLAPISRASARTMER
jgi:hypothetical protein